MYKSGELVRWMSPLDEDYSYGYIIEVRNKYATVLGTGYYKGSVALIHTRSIEKLEKGGRDSSGRSKKHY